MLRSLKQSGESTQEKGCAPEIRLVILKNCEVAHLPEREEVQSVDGPVHVVADAVVEAVKVLLGDDMVGVEVEDMVKKMPELLLLKPRQELFPSDLFHLQDN